jgi:hypothetical protein
LTKLHLPPEPQTTMLEAHHEDHNTCETQSSQLAQSSKQTLLNPKTFFTNYFRPRPFSQIGLVSDLPHKLVGLRNFLAKNTCFSHDTRIVKKKTQDTRGNSFDPELRSNFEFALVFFAFRKCPSCLFLFIISFC